MFCDLQFNFKDIFIVTIGKHMDKKYNVFLFCIEYVNLLQLETIIEKKKSENYSLGLTLCPDVNRTFMKGINACRLLPYIIFTALKTLIAPAKFL